MAEFMDKVIGILTTVGAKILLAIVVFIVGRIIINALSKALDKIRGFSKLDQTVQSFIHSLVRIGLNMLLVIAIIQVLGIPMTSVITVLASAGLAIGLSLQGALSNCAGGLMILIFKPFKVGDYIVASGAEGVVKEITVFYTHILTLDNKRIIVPNGGLMNANVTNFSYENTRRVDLVFKAAFGTDQNLVLGLMMKAAEGTKGVLADPRSSPSAPGARRRIIGTCTSTCCRTSAPPSARRASPPRPRSWTSPWKNNKIQMGPASLGSHLRKIALRYPQAP